MSEYLSQPEHQDEPLHGDQPYCANCKVQAALPGFPINLCQDCRARFNRYPIPKWMWAFAGGIAVLMIAGLARMPRYVSAAIHLTRAERAIHDHRYLAAKRESDKTLAVFPDNLDANAYNFIACAYVVDNDGIKKTYAFLEHKKIDEDLIAKVNDAMTFLNAFILDDTSQTIKVNTVAKGSTADLTNYYDSLKSEIKETDKAYIGNLIANKLFDRKAYAECETILKKVLDISPDNYVANELLAGLYRTTGKLTESLDICNRMLTDNKEDVLMLSQKSKTLLKAKQDKEAAKYALMAIGLEPKSLAAQEAEALAFYYTGKQSESKRVLAQMIRNEAGTGDSTVSTRTAQIINGNESYR